ncbi:MAG: hypothetical protein OXG44_03425 [Gammaproteobacteria bacterium]|nr:hypothetical protein [Gammaproteobacteria bacterium]
MLLETETNFSKRPSPSRRHSVRFERSQAALSHVTLFSQPGPIRRILKTLLPCKVKSVVTLTDLLTEGMQTVVPVAKLLAKKVKFLTEGMQTVGMSRRLLKLR